MTKRLLQFAKQLAYKILPPQWVRTLRNPALVPGDYTRTIKEIESVIALHMNRRGLDNEYWAEMLRKYTHIIDKGLQCAGWEPNHSSGCYSLAQEALSQIGDPIILQDPSIAWALQKLDEYEKSQLGEPPAVKPRQEPGGQHEYGELLGVIQGRRSIRQYAEKAVEIDTIEKVVEGINWCATSCNRQTAKVFATNNHDLIRACLAICKGATGFSQFVPSFLCFCADMRPYDLPMEMWLPSIDVSLGIQNCCLLAHSLGLSLVLLSWAQSSEEDERELRRLFGIPNYFRIIINGALGYPKCGGDVPLRKSVHSTLVVR